MPFAAAASRNSAQRGGALLFIQLLWGGGSCACGGSSCRAALRSAAQLQQRCRAPGAPALSGGLPQWAASSAAWLAIETATLLLAAQLC